MKRIVILLLFWASFLYAPAQVVKTKPYQPGAAVKGLAPGYGYIWIEGEWRWSPPMNRYMWVKEHWQRPPFVGQVWIPGRWATVAGGYRWIAGRWVNESSVTKTEK